MANLFLKLLCRIGSSKVPTSLLHWEDIRQVSLLLDSEAPDAAQAQDAARRLLEGKDLTIIPAGARKRIRIPKDSQVLLSLLPSGGWRYEYAVRRSKAVFKIGRTPMDALDLVVSDPEGLNFPQTEVLGKMVEIIRNLK